MLMSSPLLRRTWIGALAGGCAFATAALLQVLRTDVPLLRVIQPILFLSLIGATIGALSGPLVGQAWIRWRGDGE